MARDEQGRKIVVADRTRDPKDLGLKTYGGPWAPIRATRADMEGCPVVSGSAHTSLTCLRHTRLRPLDPLDPENAVIHYFSSCTTISSAICIILSI